MKLIRSSYQVLRIFLCVCCVRDVPVYPDVILAWVQIFFFSLIIFLRFLGCSCFVNGFELSLCLPSTIKALQHAETACFVQRLQHEGVNKQNVLTLGGEYEDIYCNYLGCEERNSRFITVDQSRCSRRGRRSPSSRRGRRAGRSSQPSGFSVKTL